MSLRVTYIGEEVAAAGFALAGARVRHAPIESRRVWSLLEAARAESDLVILNGAHAECVQDALHDLLLRHPLPPVFVLPPMGESSELSNAVVSRARRALGLVAVDEKQSQGGAS